MLVTVEGKIKGKARPRVFNGRAVTPKDTVNYENWVRMNYKEQDGRYLEGPIEAIKEGLEYPCKTPDTDNIAKVVLDSLNGIAYKDDKQIVKLIVLKKWTEGIERIEFGLEEI